MKKYYTLGWILFLAACTGPTNDETVNRDTVATRRDSLPSSPAANNIAGCYRMVIEKDTAHMELTQQDSIITGPLVYKRFEKDSNAGKLVLQIKKDRMEGWYTFSSEGKLTVRQFVFKYENGNLEEGYGDVIMKGDSVFFKYPSALRFEDRNPFIRSACP